MRSCILELFVQKSRYQRHISIGPFEEMFRRFVEAWMLARDLCPPDVAQFQLCSYAEFEDKE